MNKSLSVLSTLLKQAPDNAFSRYARFLPQSVLAEAQTIKPQTHPLSDLSLKELLEKIDPSWYMETLRACSKNDLTFYLSLFSEQTRDTLAKELALTPPFYSLPPNMKHYFLTKFLQTLFPNDLPLPFSYLPDHPLSFLLESNIEKLNKLCFYLGLYDIAPELKTVLKGSILKAFETTLSSDEANFCRTISALRTPFSLGPVGLNQWNEDKSLLRKIIFERGLYRIGIGLNGACSDFVWYITHLLPKETAALLHKFLKTTVDPSTLTLISQQILTAWKGI